MAFTQADLDSIDRTIVSGTLEVRFQDRTITYKSTQELLAARALITGAIGTTPPTNRQIRMMTQKGY